ncbi:MAG: hypothetical protein Q8L22_21270 [Reyranella sp.]|nr:hypothetical protein [Reyranella sp.]
MLRFIALLGSILISTASFGQDRSGGIEQFFGTWSGNVVVPQSDKPSQKIQKIRFELKKCGETVCGTLLMPVYKVDFLRDFQDCSKESPPSLCKGLVCPPFKGCLGDDLVGTEKRCIMRFLMESGAIILASNCVENQRTRMDWGTFARRR